MGYEEFEGFSFPPDLHHNRYAVIGGAGEIAIIGTVNDKEGSRTVVVFQQDYPEVDAGPAYAASDIAA